MKINCILLSILKCFLMLNLDDFHTTLQNFNAPEDEDVPCSGNR